MNWVLRRPRPQQITFGPSYPSLTGLTFNGWELDRELLAELDQAVWDSLASATQRQLTDDVIENAVRRLPRTHYDLNGEFLTNALKQRRDRLPEEALEYYRLISRWVEVKGTDQSEYAEFEHKEHGQLDVRIGLLDDGTGNRVEPYFQRAFDPGTTRYENDPADANKWHVGYGGGLWISVIDRMQTLSVAIAKGR